jgi:hypothetical protein
MKKALGCCTSDYLVELDGKLETVMLERTYYTLVHSGEDLHRVFQIKKMQPL